MNSLTKKILVAGLTVVTAVSLSGMAQAASLTQTQVDAIITLLQSFGADAATVSNVQSALTGAPVTGGTGGTVATACSFSKDLTLGSTGDDVKCLQQYLNAAGYSVAASGVGSAGNETTYFGSLTQSALAKWQAAMSVTPSVGYFGPLSRAKYTSVAGSTGSTGGTTVPGVPVPATGLAVSLASNNPSSSAVPSSAANVPFLRFNIAGSGTVSSIVLKRTGAGATADFSNVYLYDGATRLTSGRSVNSSSHEVSFNNLNLSVSGAKTLTVSADVAASGTAGAANRNAFQIVSVAADTSVSGVPVSGQEFTISNASAGTLTVEKTGSLSNPNIGQLDALLSTFRLTPASEDASVNRIALFFTGSISKSNVTNFELRDSSNTVLATAAGINAKDLVVFELSSPLTILKGDNKLFSVYGDIGGSAKNSETIKLYVDESSDIFATGAQFGYGMGVTKTSFDSDTADHHVLTLQGAEFTITFNGPNTGDVAKRGKDVTLFDFNLASASNVEVRTIRFDTATTGITSADGALEDVKIVDADTGVTVAGPQDVSTLLTTGEFTFTDIFNVNAGQSRHLRLTADIPSNWDDADAITITLVNFTSGSDLKNLDNNQFLATAEYSPSTSIVGNQQTIVAPTLDVALAGTPVSDSFVKGTLNTPFLGLSLRAVGDDIKVTTIKVTSSQSSSSDPTDKSDVTSLRLFEGTTQVGTVKSLTGAAAPYTATFDNLNYVIPKGATKVLTVKGNLSSAATAGNAYSLMVANVAGASAGVDVVALDTEGNEPVYQISGTGTTSATESLNGADTVQLSVLSSGSMNVSQAPADADSKAGIILANSSQVILSKFNFTANNEDLTVKKLKVLVNNDNSTSAAATSTDEITRVYLFDSSNNLIGNVGGYSVPTSGTVTIENLSWLVTKDQTKALVVRGDVNTIDAGADTGQELYAHIKADGFEASGSATTISGFANAGGAMGREKVVYKTKPTIARADLASTLLNTPVDLEIARFTITADAKEQIAWGAVGVEMSLLNASFSDVAFSVRDVINSLDLTVGTQAPTTSGLDLTGDSAKSAIIYLGSPEQISAGSSRTYIVKINATASQFGTAQETETLTSKLVLHNDSSTANLANGATFSFGAAARVDTTLNSADNAFVWSDFSLPGTEDADADWANGVYLDTFPSSPVWILTRTN